MIPSKKIVNKLAPH